MSIHLPAEILTLIFIQLDSSSILQCQQVCHYWADVLNYDGIYKLLYEPKYTNTDNWKQLYLSKIKLFKRIANKIFSNQMKIKKESDKINTQIWSATFNHIFKNQISTSTKPIYSLPDDLRFFFTIYQCSIQKYIDKDNSNVFTPTGLHICELYTDQISIIDGYVKIEYYLQFYCENYDIVKEFSTNKKCNWLPILIDYDYQFRPGTAYLINLNKASPFFGNIIVTYYQLNGILKAEVCNSFTELLQLLLKWDKKTSFSQWWFKNYYLGMY